MDELDWDDDRNLPLFWSLLPWYGVTEDGCWEWLGTYPRGDGLLVHEFNEREYLVGWTVCFSRGRMRCCVRPEHADAGGLNG